MKGCVGVGLVFSLSDLRHYRASFPIFRFFALFWFRWVGGKSGGASPGSRLPYLSLLFLVSFQAFKCAWDRVKIDTLVILLF